MEFEDQCVTISEKIKEYFKMMGITQLDAAKQLGVSQAAVSALLNGKPFGKNLAKKWSDTFGFKPNWLLTGEGQMLKAGRDIDSEGSANQVDSLKNDEMNNPYGVIDRLTQLVEDGKSTERTLLEYIGRLITVIEKDKGIIPETPQAKKNIAG